MIPSDDTIVALSTGNPVGAISVLRLSGDQSRQIVEQIFTPTRDTPWQSYGIRHGQIYDGEQWIDEVLVSYFQAPHTYTGEDVVEISCHSSSYIVDQIYNLLISHGARPAQAGEFTMRRFLHSKIDLSQAEAVADMIAAENKSMHDIASRQMKGQFSSRLAALRQQLVDYAALTELELDFAEEDVEFADREAFAVLLQELETNLQELIRSFRYGQVIKEGVPVVIAGKPNAGKSSLLNLLLGEDKAIVSSIPGTTRDVLEDTITLSDIKFRFIDTAGLRDTEDQIESVGVERAHQKIAQAKILIYLYDPKENDAAEIATAVGELHKLGAEEIFVVENKNDLTPSPLSMGDDIRSQLDFPVNLMSINTQSPSAIQPLIDTLLSTVQSWKTEDTVIITNRRHLQGLQDTLASIRTIQQGLEGGLSGDLLSIDIRQALRQLGSITGEIDIDQDVLGTIFGRFCIGK